MYYDTVQLTPTWGKWTPGVREDILEVCKNILWDM
jgi:hypothetical protein